MRQETILEMMGSEWRTVSDLADDLDPKPERHKAMCTGVQSKLKALRKYGFVECRTVMMNNRPITQWRLIDVQESRRTPPEDDGREVQGAEDGPAVQGQSDVLPGDGLERPGRAVEGDKMIPTTDDIRRLLSDGTPRTAHDIADAFGAEPTKSCLDRINMRLRSLERYSLAHIVVPRRQGRDGFLPAEWAGVPDDTDHRRHPQTTG